ncbi:MAG TPA: WcaI family glycosyltransferase [Verrucomicrobiae bacterium]|jgi:colanic acid biosynthesis glycosyl transferase WcaI|nr:WcaI family glycosyltransferase [Verrucomicrobiae bacterium]
MRILVLGINYWPEETGIAVFNTGRCEYLAAKGHHVTMVTGFPYYPRWRVAPEYRGRLVARERRNGVEIRRSWLYVPRRVTTLRRVLHEASFIASATLRAALGSRPDLLMTVSPPLGLALSSVLLGRLWGIPYVFHVPDLQPDAAVELGMLPTGRVVRLLYAVERLAYRHAALISTLTRAMQQRIIDKGIAPSRVTLFPDWADPALFSLPTTGGGAEARRTFDLGERFVVLHAGNMGVKQGLDVVVDAAARTRDRADIVYLLVGDGAARPALEARAAAAGLPNLRFLPLQPDPVFRDLLAAANLTLVTQQAVVADIVFPSKVLTVLAAAKPVVASLNASSEVARVIIEARAGLVTPAEDGAALADAVRALRDDPERRRQMAAEGRVYARAHWDRALTLGDMERALRAVVVDDPRAARLAASTASGGPIGGVGAR